MSRPVMTTFALAAGLCMLCGSALAACCPYCGRSYGAAMPGDEARVYALRRQHEAT